MRTLSTFIFAALALTFGTIVIQSISPPGAPPAAPEPAEESPEADAVYWKIRAQDDRAIRMAVLVRPVTPRPEALRPAYLPPGRSWEVWRVRVGYTSGREATRLVVVERRPDGELLDARLAP